MDQLRKSIEDSERSRLELEKLRQDKSKEGLIKYNEALLEAADRQLNIYVRLRLMGDSESTRTADEMVYVAEQYLGKEKDRPFEYFMEMMRKEIIWQLNMLTAGEYPEESDRE